MRKIYLTLFLLLFPFLASACYGDDFFGHHMDMMGFGFFGGGFYIILFWALIIIGAVYLIKYFVSKGKKDGKKKEGEDKAKGILEERYARGEIDEEEFNKKKKDLKL